MSEPMAVKVNEFEEAAMRLNEAIAQTEELFIDRGFVCRAEVPVVVDGEPLQLVWTRVRNTWRLCIRGQGDSTVEILANQPLAIRVGVVVAIDALFNQCLAAREALTSKVVDAADILTRKIEGFRRYG